MSGGLGESGPVLAPGDRGTTRIADRVVRRVAGRAAREVLGPDGGEVVRTSADVRGSRVDSVRLDVGLAYPTHLETSGAELQRRVTERTARLTGLTVSHTAVRITRLVRSPASASVEPVESVGSVESLGSVESVESVESVNSAPFRTGRRRPWSERRSPAALFALIGAAVCGALLADVVAVALGREPSGVRLRTLDWLTSHGPADTAVAVGAAVATVVGLWTLFAALIPGLRGRLPMSGTAAAAIDRPAAAALVRRRTADVPGVLHVRVTAGRRRITVRARIGFGDPDEARDVLTRTAQDAATGLGLAKPPRVRVQVSRDTYWQPPGPPDREHDPAHNGAHNGAHEEAPAHVQAP